MQKLYKCLNQENGNAQPEQGSNYFKFFIGTGNNYSCVRQIIKRRSWWHRQKTEKFIGQLSLEQDSESEDKTISGCHFIWTQWRKTELTDHLKVQKNPKIMYNRLENNFHLANKKALFMNMNTYYRAMNQDPFEVAIPMTFHIKSQTDPEY